jgi:hypothetical protein
MMPASGVANDREKKNAKVGHSKATTKREPNTHTGEGRVRTQSESEEEERERH